MSKAINSSKLAIFINILWLTTCVQCESRVEYTIGALFHEDTDAELQIAFECALDNFSKYNDKGISFNTAIRIVSKDNSFDVHNTVCEMLETEGGGHGVIALFGPISSSVAGVVTSLSNNLGLPNIQIHPPSRLWSYDTENVMSINVHPSLEVYQKGIATVLYSLQWKKYAILYEDISSITKLQDVISATTINEDQTIVLKLVPPDFREVLKEVKKSGFTYIIVDIQTDLIMKLLEQAQELSMLDDLFSYFFTSLDMFALDLSHLNFKANISTVRATDGDDKRVQDFIKTCGVGRTIYDPQTEARNGIVNFGPSLMWDAVNVFTTTFREIYITQKGPIAEKATCQGDAVDSSFRYSLANFMKVKPIPDTITGDILFENSVRSTMALETVKISQGQLQKTALWNSNDPDNVVFIKSEKEQQEEIDTYMKKTTFIVASKIGQPYLMRRTPSRPDEVLEGNDRYEGYAMDVIDHIAKMLNFTYRFELTPDGKHGVYDKEKKSWNGLIREILDRRAHLGICDLTITEERRSAVDFSSPFMSLGVSILYSKAKPEPRDIFAFMDPFDTAVWLYILVAYISVSFVLQLLTRMAPGEWENPNPSNLHPEELENIWDLRNNFWLILGSTMSQGSDILPKGVSSRMGISMWWFFILIINASYTANLAAFLTTSNMGPNIKSAEDLSKQTTIKYGCLDGGATQTLFKNSNFSTYQRMWAQMVQAKPSVFVKDNSDGVRLVKTTKNQLFAFFMESSSIEYEKARDCDLKQVGGRMDNKGYGIAMPINAPYRGAINLAILKMHESGVFRAIKNKWWTTSGETSCKDDSSDSASDMKLALANIGGVFVVVGSGIFVAFMIAIAEFLWNIHVLSVDEHQSYKQVILSELKFAICIWITQKRAHPLSTSSPNLSNNVGRETPKSFDTAKNE